MTLNKNSFFYFILFFSAVIISFILVLYLTHLALENKIESAKNEEINNILTQNMSCKNFNQTKIEHKDIFFCSKDDVIAFTGISDFAYAGTIKYMVFVNTTNSTIKHINILEHQETPGLGNKIEDKNWLASIYNKMHRDLKIKQKGGLIDSFTAASITPKKLLKSLREDLKWTKHNHNKIKTIINQG